MPCHSDENNFEDERTSSAVPAVGETAAADAESEEEREEADDEDRQSPQPHVLPPEGAGQRGASEHSFAICYF